MPPFFFGSRRGVLIAWGSRLTSSNKLNLDGAPRRRGPYLGGTNLSPGLAPKGRCLVVRLFAGWLTSPLIKASPGGFGRRMQAVTTQLRANQLRIQKAVLRATQTSGERKCSVLTSLFLSIQSAPYYKKKKKKKVDLGPFFELGFQKFLRWMANVAIDRSKA